MNLIDFKSKFDWKNYVSKYPDLKGADTLEKAWIHANNFGWKEHRMIFDDVQLQDKFIAFKKTGVMTSEPKDNEIKQQLVEEGINMYNLNNLTDEHINKISKNVHGFSDQIKPYNKILFISGDYPGYGGAATNCYELQKYFKTSGHTTFGFYFNYESGTNAKHEIHDDHIIDDVCKLKSIEFKPELIILKSPVNIELKSLFKCPVYYLIGGIYKNDLDKYHYDLDSKEENDKYINKDVLNHILKCDQSFANSQHTADILQKFYDLSTNLFYSSFVPYVDKKVLIDPDFEMRKYNYGLIVSNFERKIKNVEKSVEFLKDKENVVLIGKGSERYKSYGFTCIDLVGKQEMDKYYKQIKYIVQDSFYESCSNVKIEGLFNGCRMSTQNSRILGILLIQQYPGNFFENYIQFLKTKFELTDIRLIVYIYSSSKAKQNAINCDIPVVYVNDENIYNVTVNKCHISKLLILYLPLQFVDNFHNFDRLMNETTVEKYIFLGGIVNHMYAYIDKYNISNTLGYGNGYKLLYNNINHSNLSELMYPTYDYGSINKIKNSQKKQFIHIGRFSIEKNQLFLVKAFHCFLKNIDDFSYKLFMVAKNENEIKLDIEDYILKNNLGNNIIVMKWMSHTSLFDFCIKEIDYNILTSTNEGLSSICLEMMKIGIPTISSNICCVNEIITDNVNGLLFDYFNYFELLKNNKKNARDLANEINNHIDNNIQNLVGVLKKTINNLPLLNKLTAECFTMSNKLINVEDNYLDIFNYNKDVLIVMNNPSKWHGEFKTYELLSSCKLDFVYINNISHMDIRKYDYIILDFLIVNPVLQEYDNHNELKQIIGKYLEQKTVIMLLHDLHWWSFDTRRTILNRDFSSLIEKNHYYYSNIKLLRDLNVKYMISLYNNFELENIIKDSDFITNTYINYYPCDNNFQKQIVPKKYSVICYGSTTDYIYPLRNKVYNYIKNGVVDKCMVLENLTQYGKAIKQRDLSTIINQSWLCLATVSSFEYYLRKYNEIGNTSCVIIGNIIPEIKYIIGNNYIYISNECNEHYFKEVVNYYMNNKEILCYLNYHCNMLLLKNNNSHSYKYRLLNIISNIKYKTSCNLDYINYNLLCGNVDKNNYFYIKKEVKISTDTILLSKQKYDEIYMINSYDDYFVYYIDKIYNDIEGKFYSINKFKLINQIYGSENVILNCNMISYFDQNVPTFIVGINDNTIHILETHQDLIILMLSDSDIVNINSSIIHKIHSKIQSKQLYLVSTDVNVLLLMKQNKLCHMKVDHPFLHKNPCIHIYSEHYYRFNINYYFDKIYVLNLKRDIVKRKRIEELFERFHINNYEFYEAIDGKNSQELLDKYNDYSKVPFTEREKGLGRKLIGSVGVLANLISVKNIVMDAKKNKYKKILFFEDDIILSKKFNSLFTDITSRIDDDWKILYLGVQNIINENTIFMNNTYDCNINSSGGWSFGIDSSVYDEIINECNKEELPFDSGPLHHLREKYPDKCKVIFPNICICDTSSSSIRDYKRNLNDDAIRFNWNLDDFD